MRGSQLHHDGAGDKNKHAGRENVAGRSLQQKTYEVIYFSREYTPHGETKMLYSHAEKMIDKPIYVVLTGGSRFPPANIPIHHPFRQISITTDCL
jgi:hypothetical protein